MPTKARQASSVAPLPADETHLHRPRVDVTHVLEGQARPLGRSRRAAPALELPEGPVVLPSGRDLEEAVSDAGEVPRHRRAEVHTQEPPGLPWQYDRIEDTCPGTNCVGDVSMYLMEPGALPPGTPLLTAGQALVMRRHVLVDPGRATFTPGALLGVGPLLAASRLTNVRCPTCP